MKPVVCLYCEEHDTQFAVVRFDKDGPQVVSVGSTAAYQKDESGGGKNTAGAAERKMNERLALVEQSGVKLSSADVVSINRSPVVKFIKRDSSDPSTLPIQEAVLKDKSTRKTREAATLYDYIEIKGQQLLTIQAPISDPCADAAVKFSNERKKKLTITSRKTAETSLAFYAARVLKFFPDDATLLLHLGQGDIMPVFMAGRQIDTIASPVKYVPGDTASFERTVQQIMKNNRGTSSAAIDTVVISGRVAFDQMETSLKKQFPAAEIKELPMHEFNAAMLARDTRRNLSRYAVPVAAAYERAQELAGEYTGPNLMAGAEKTLQKEKGGSVFSAVLLVASILLLAFAAYFVTVTELELVEKQEALSKTKSVLVTNAEEAARLAELTSTIDEYGARENAVAQVSSERLRTTAFLEKISAAAERLGDVTVTAMQVEADGSFLIHGFAYAKTSIVEFSSDVGPAEVKQFSFYPGARGGVYSFVIAFGQGGDR